MDEIGNVVASVAIEPKHVYGLRPEVIGNINFNVNQEVIYPVEAVLAFHDFVNNKQRFLRFPPNTSPSIIKLNQNRLLMGVVEITDTDEHECITNIVVYDLQTLKKQRSFQLPSHARNKKITELSFTYDTSALIALTEYPDEMIYMLNFNRLGTIIEGRAGNTNQRGIASCIACNPQNQDYVAVCGNGLMKLLRKSEKGFTLNGEIKPDFNATSVAWISADMYIVGTALGILILFEHSTKKVTFQAKEVETLDLTKEPDPEDPTQEPPPAPSASDQSEAIVCMTTFAKGLAYAIFNQVYVFERVSKTRYERKTVLDIPMGKYPNDLYQITNMAINLKQDTVIVTPKHSQIYAGVLIVPESLKTKRLKFRTLGEHIHIDEIIDIGVCAWRPIVITSSKDKTIRVWNYQTNKVELVKRFPMEVTVIELDPSGQYVAVGFADKVKFMQIFMDDLNVIKDYNFSNASDIKFSNLGHLMATAYGSSIAITSVFKLETLKTLKGHTGPVKAVAWARNDKSIFSGGDDGALYQWDLEIGIALQKLIHPRTVYNSLCVGSDSRTLFAATNTGSLQQVIDSKVVREIQMPVQSPLSYIALTKSDLIMFAATKGGHLYNIPMPFSSVTEEKVTRYSFFNSAITKIRFSYDGSLLISSTAGGTLVFWQLKNTEGKLAPIDQDLLKSQEVLISRKDLEDKIERIKSLEDRLKQQAAEFYKKQSQNEENDQQQMASIHKGYCDALAELKAKNDEIGARHAKELTQITLQIDELTAEHKASMESQAEKYSERMQMEYQKFSSLREKMLNIRDSYEEKLSKSKLCLQDTMEALEKDFRNQLEERQELIRQLIKEMDDKKLEFTEYCQKIEIENDRKMIDCQIEYEKKVKFERDETDKWKAEADAHQAKFDNIKKETDNFLEEVAKLKEEHYKSKAQIAEYRNDIRDLHKDVADREQAIRVKENRIEEILLKNEELEKYKLVLNHKINELKAQIEPRELQIVEKRKQITEMEQELSGLQKNNLQLELQLKELKDKCLSADIELKTETGRAKSARLCITDMCAEIYELAGNLNHPEKLKGGIKHLFVKYSSDDALKKFVTLDTQIQAELHKQRDHIEKIMFGCKQKMKEKSYLGKSKKLMGENKILQEEVQQLRVQNESVQTEIKDMDALVKIIAKTKPISVEKRVDTVVEVERIDKYFRDQVAALEENLNALVEENEKITENLHNKREMLHKSSF